MFELDFEYISVHQGHLILLYHAAIVPLVGCLCVQQSTLNSGHIIHQVIHRSARFIENEISFHTFSRI